MASFIDKLKERLFWKLLLRFSITFFVILIFFTIIFKSWSYVWSGNWDAILEEHFRKGKWVRFFLTKFVIIFFYGIYVTNKNMDKVKN